MNFLPVLLCSLALIVGLRPILVDSGCCNENLWCDGDPRLDSSDSFTNLEFLTNEFLTNVNCYASFSFARTEKIREKNW